MSESPESTYKVAQPAGLTVKYEPRELTMHHVTQEELSTLRAVGPTASVGFLGIALGAALTFWGVLKSTGLKASDRADFKAAFLASRLLTAFFAIVAIVGYVRLFLVIRRIKQRPQQGEVVSSP